jgi:hypothetical protein
MLWLRRFLKSEEGYGTVELLILIVGVSFLAFQISGKLLEAIRPIHRGTVQNIKGVTQSGH